MMLDHTTWKLEMVQDFPKAVTPLQPSPVASA